LLTETEVLPAIPPSGFVRDYVVHALKQTTSPLCYHLLVGLGVLATTCPINYGMTYAGTLRSNIFGLLVGRSGEEQKSTAVTIGRELLFRAASPLVGDYPGSPEGLLESLQRSPSQLIPMGEFGRFLASAQRGYFEPMKALMTDLWDAQAQQRAKANGKNVRVDDPRLSVMAACSLPYLEKYTMAEDWTGGFMGRWIVMYGQRERTDPDPAGDNSMVEYLTNFLQERALVPSAAECVGLTDSAKRLWADWFNDISNRPLPDVITGIRARAPTLARKVALIYAWDWRKPTDEPWYLDEMEIEYAIRFIELHVKSLVGISHAIADSPDARARREVIEAMKLLNRPCDMGDLIKMLKWKKRPMQETIDALVEERAIAKDFIGGNLIFRLRTATEVQNLEQARWIDTPWE
jgi:hypothetical protein